MFAVKLSPRNVREAIPMKSHWQKSPNMSRTKTMPINMLTPRGTNVSSIIDEDSQATKECSKWENQLSTAKSAPAG